MSPLERTPIANDARRGDRARRTRGAACALCGLIDPTVLVPVERTLLEAHHVAGAANDAYVVVWLCRNCHALATEAQRDSGVALSRTERRHLLERLEAALRSLASFLSLLVAALVGWADGLAALVADLDAALPAWRFLNQGAQS